jgi:hypothetical protein
MRTALARCCGVLLVVSVGWSATLQTQGPARVRWYRGNLHTHTINSDGDSTPADVMAWYKRNGYQFLVITDHNTLTDPASLDPNPHDDFLMIGGEEITNPKAVHVNAIGISRAIAPQKAGDVAVMLQASIDAVREQGGLPLINHPNFLWAFTAAEMRGLKGAGLLEIASGHPLVNHAGDGRTPSTEDMWDDLLSGGMRLYGAAVDDSHNFREEFTVHRANPGRAWVAVRATALSRDAVLDALGRGDFYASTGVVLADHGVQSGALTIAIDAVAAKRYRTVFIGRGGAVLHISYDNPAAFAIPPGSGYVRARVEDSGGMRAWTQPVFTGAHDDPRTPR